MRPSALPLRGITVPQIAKKHGFEIENRVMWSAGLRAQARFAKLTGMQPPKDNRPKTHTKGVHCFAIYPNTFEEEILECLRLAMAGPSKQGDLFS